MQYICGRRCIYRTYLGWNPELVLVIKSQITYEIGLRTSSSFVTLIVWNSSPLHMVSKEDSNSPFSICSNCQQVVVHLGAHTCPQTLDTVQGATPTLEQRVDRATRDGRSETDSVIVLRSNSAYAYHECADGDPVCHLVPEDSNWVVITREEAKSRGLQPCGECK
jgi:hypothetical protein